MRVDVSVRSDAQGDERCLESSAFRDVVEVTVTLSDCRPLCGGQGVLGSVVTSLVGVIIAELVELRHGLIGEVGAVGNLPFVVGLEQHSADEPETASSFGLRQEGGPERLVFAVADVDAEHLAVPIGGHCSVATTTASETTRPSTRALT